MKKNEDWFTVRWDGLYAGKRNADECYVIRDLVYSDAVKEFKRLLKRDDVSYAVIGYTNWDDDNGLYDLPIMDCRKKAFKWNVNLRDRTKEEIAWKLEGAEYWQTAEKL